jgi:hypothetical protein
MTQGKPVSLTEQRKIWEFHQAGYFPSQIALHLSRNYAEENGGYRSTETVKDAIKRLEARAQETGGDPFVESTQMRTQPAGIPDEDINEKTPDEKTEEKKGKAKRRR